MKFRNLGPRALGIIFFLVLSGVATSALAAGGGEGHGESNIFAGDIGNVLWTLLTFGLVVFVLGKFAWGPVTDTLKKREDFIRDSLESIKKDSDAAAARLDELEQRLVDARAEATAIVEEGRRDAEVMREREKQKAQADADQMIARARREIEIARATALKELYEVSGRLATDLAGRIVARELKPADHDRLIKDAITEIGQLEQ